MTSAGDLLSCQEIMGRTWRSSPSRKIPQQRWADRESEAIAAGEIPLARTASAMACIVDSTTRSASCSTRPGRGYVQGYSR